MDYIHFSLHFHPNSRRRPCLIYLDLSSKRELRHHPSSRRRPYQQQTHLFPYPFLHHPTIHRRPYHHYSSPSPTSFQSHLKDPRHPSPHHPQPPLQPMSALGYRGSALAQRS